MVIALTLLLMYAVSVMFVFRAMQATTVLEDLDRESGATTYYHLLEVALLWDVFVHRMWMCCYVTI